MITLTRLNGTRVCVNAFLIEHLEETPDTVVTLTTGHRFLVQEPMDEVIDAAVVYMGRLHELGASALVIARLEHIT